MERANLFDGPRRTLWLGLSGAALLYVAQPPLALGWVAWIAPVPWILLVRDEALAGRRPYKTLWLAGFVHWLVTIQWLRLPHPANYAAWLFVAIYLGLYAPAFVAIARVAVHRFRWPLWIAAPVAWTGLEWLRVRLLTGFLMASLAHTQIASPRVIQIADLGGEYLVTFLIVLVAAAIAQAVSSASADATSRPRKIATPLVVAVVALTATIGYGHRRLAQWGSPTKDKPRVRIALIQSDMPADWKGDDDRDANVMQQQFELTEEAAKNSDRPIDLVVWPETMFRQPLFVRDAANPPPEGEPAGLDYALAPRDLSIVAEMAKSAILVGIDRVVVTRAERTKDSTGYKFIGHNAAVCVDRTGKIVGAYDKMHLLPFGEYVPLVDWIPLLRRVTPITGGALPGSAAAGMSPDGAVVYAPNICYESVVPHLVRGQFVELAAAGRAPDVLVNVTNDAWYWGSSELDMHLASGVFRAVELRTPLVAAANRGLSAHIDAAGQVVAMTERDRPAVLLCDVLLAPDRKAQLPTLYAVWGDWLPTACVICCGILVLLGWWKRRTDGDPASTSRRT